MCISEQSAEIRGNEGKKYTKSPTKEISILAVHSYLTCSRQAQKLLYVASILTRGGRVNAHSNMR